jgi:hypothetical protein
MNLQHCSIRNRQRPPGSTCFNINLSTRCRSIHIDCTRRPGLQIPDLDIALDLALDISRRTPTQLLRLRLRPRTAGSRSAHRTGDACISPFEFGRFCWIFRISWRPLSNLAIVPVTSTDHTADVGLDPSRQDGGSRAPDHADHERHPPRDGRA